MNGRVHVLAGDIGGTKTLLQIAEFDAGSSRARVLAEQRFDSSAYPDLAPMAFEFLASNGTHGVDRACFGVAGPVVNEDGRQRARLTNLPWQLDSARLARELHLTRVRIINDFQAVGYGIEGIERDSLEVLQDAPIRPGEPRLVIGAGTGLGVALLHRCGDYYDVLPTEGGHMDYAPRDDDQIELLRWLRGRHGRVSYERVVSGMGIEEVFRFLCEREGLANEPLLRAPDVAAAVSHAALVGNHTLARCAMDIFVDGYGSVTGNFALAMLAHGGVFIAGGIAPKILPSLQDGRFMNAFNDKGRMAPLTRGMPVHVITDPKIGLRGAACAARRL